MHVYYVSIHAMPSLAQLSNYCNICVGLIISFQCISLVAEDRVLWLFPRELQSPSPWGHCSSSLPPPTKTAQSQLETKAPLAEGMWDDGSIQDS